MYGKGARAVMTDAATLRRLGYHSPPSDATEISIAEIFAEILDVDPAAVSSATSFFDFGGTSLDVLKLKRKLELLFGHAEIPIATVLRNPTVRALAVCCTPALETMDYDPVVPLQVKGGKVPLFCVHTETGEVLGFLRLANYFANDRPFYVLRARGFNDREKCFTSFDEMVETYTVAIRWHRPHGPYAIAGYSYGGLVAFEIAKRLESQGEHVAFVGSIDMPPWLLVAAEPMDCAVKLALLLSMIDRRQAELLAGRLRLAQPPEDPCVSVMKIAQAERLVKLALSLAAFKTWTAVTQSLQGLTSSYVPSGTVESVTVFYAHPPRGTKEDWHNRLTRWDEFTRMPNRYIDVPGEHYTLMGAKHVARFQAALRSELERALRGC
jgi:thioesterase domain-containing protein/acyl carrier protein